MNAETAARVGEIHARLAALAHTRGVCCEVLDALNALDDERERLLRELETLDRTAYRAEAL